MDATLESQARELLGRMDVRVPPIDLKGDLADLDEVLDRCEGADLPDRLIAALLNSKARTFAAVGHPDDAVQVQVELIARFEQVADPATAHTVDLALMDQADLLLADLQRPDEGVEVARRLLARFQAAPQDKYLPFKGLMLADLLFTLLAFERPEVMLDICHAVKTRLSDGDEMSQALVAEALFYEMQAIMRTRPTGGVSDRAALLIETGEPGLRALQRVAEKFSGDQRNAIWVLQIDMQRAMILLGLGRLDEARKLSSDGRQRANELGVAPDMLIEFDAFDRDLADAE